MHNTIFPYGSYFNFKHLKDFGIDAYPVTSNHK